MRTSLRFRLPFRQRYLAVVGGFALLGAFTGVGQPASVRVPPPVIQASGGQLTIAGQPTDFTGVDAYELATDWGVNAGCGAMLDDQQLNSFYSSLRPGSLVRFQAFQETTAINPATGKVDWAPLDRVFAAAAAHRDYLIPVVTGQGSGCDGGHWQDLSWYKGGYKSIFNNSSNSDGRGLTPLSYRTYLQELVERYRNSPALGMWEPIGEPEASTCPGPDEPTNCSGHQTCPDEAAASLALRSFFDNVGELIHRWDPTHLVESGLLGGGQCGSAGNDYQSVSASPGIDVLSYHDYYGGARPEGGDQWNGIAERLSQATALGKPIIAGEIGIDASIDGSCADPKARVDDLQGKLEAQTTGGASGELVWNWSPDPLGSCSFNITSGDPVMSLLSRWNPN